MKIPYLLSFPAAKSGLNPLCKPFGLLVLLAALGGCAAGPAPKQPAAPAPARDTATIPAARAEVRKAVPVQSISSEWSALFQSSHIDALIGRAFNANPNAGAAQAALRRSLEFPVARQGFFYPSVLVDAPVPDKPAGSKGDAAPGTQDYYGIRTARLSVGFVPEMLGAKNGKSGPPRLQDEVQREASYFTLAANVIAAAIQEASLRAQIGAQLNIVGLNRQSLEIVRNQFKLGYVSEEEVRQFELEAAHAQQALAPLQQQLEETRGMLSALAGRAPEEDDAEAFAVDALKPVRALPSSLPSQLVEQRPDVRMAEAQLYEVAAQYGVTVVNKFPRFAIEAAPGGKKESSAWMQKSGGRFFDPKVDVAKIVFGAKAAKGKPRATRLALNRAAAQYRRVVMAALQDVADTLNAIAMDDRTLKAAARTAQTAGKAGEQTRKQYEDGQSGFQSLLFVQQHEQFAIIDLLQAQTSSAGNSIALFHALGGRWWKREAPAKAGKP
ncbi:MAG: efflux transporter outer membrane subunit [Sideroxyarcus sp.]|nr:efflux transporter outer membrane subunit [Sideroxyarcus sp.]